MNSDAQRLSLSEWPAWKRLIVAIAFLPQAWRAIGNRQLVPDSTFQLVNRFGRPFGISAGDFHVPSQAPYSQALKEIVVGLEDRRFYSHQGIDLRGIARALLRNIRKGRIVEGGSTITQQLVRNSLLSPDRSAVRKILEVILALKLERHYSKDEILHLYFEFCYLGKGTRGFETAARVIFRRPLRSLSDRDLCALAGLLRTPNRTFPKAGAVDFRERQLHVERVLGRTASGSALGDQNPIEIGALRRERLSQIIHGELAKFRSCRRANVCRVFTTIDVDLQRQIDAELKNLSLSAEIEYVAAVVLANASGEVLAESACVAGNDAQFSPTFSGSTQAGSTFKTFAVLAALEQGFALDFELQSAPFESQFIFGRNGKPWRVRNYANVYRGSITLQEAFRHSDNTAFARLVECLDLDHLYEVYRRFGVLQSSIATPSIVLGATREGTRLIDLASAYCAIASIGTMTTPRLIRGIEYKDGSLAINPAHAIRQVIVDMGIAMQLRAALGYAALPLSQGAWAGKSGTTSNSSIYVGYSDHVSAAVLMGFRAPQEEVGHKGISASSAFVKLSKLLLGYRSNLLSI